ncbi:MAG: FtsW/RodA/SpoVE family cell cycle protein, partial [Desulfobacterales bacterium]|nr:FtsW/RodA/SpoVE family cell cycle protein [Desulfobacterales bacterium]
MIRQQPPKNNPQSGYDIKLLFPVLFLVGIGIVMVYSSSSALALKEFGVDYYFFKKQTLFSLLGILVLVGCRHIPLKLFCSMAYPLLILALLLLIAVKVSGFGVAAGGSTRWLRLGLFTCQPSEFARFSLVLYLAYSMSKKLDKLK